MKQEELLKEEDIINFLKYIQNLSKDSIENISKLINKEKRKIFKENRKICKLGDQSKKLNSNQFNKIIDFQNDYKTKICFFLMYYLGLRVSEVVLIKLNDIIDNKLTIHNIKARRIETRIIPKSIRISLNNYIKINKNQIKRFDNYLFYFNNELKHITKDSLRNKFRRTTLKLGINKVYAYSNHKGNKRKLYIYSTHSLRYSFANNFYKKSKNDIEKTRIAMRHSLVKDTQTYIKGSINEVNKIMEML